MPLEEELRNEARHRMKTVWRVLNPKHSRKDGRAVRKRMKEGEV